METRWQWQLQRVERYYRRCQQLVEANSPVANDLEFYQLSDHLVSFFVHCYHLKDWLKTDPRYPACSRNSPCGQDRCPECRVNDHPPLKICADNANGVKHLNIKDAKVDEFEIEAGKIGNLEDRISCFSKDPPDDAVWRYLTHTEGWRSPPECAGCIDYQDRLRGIDRGPCKCEGCADPFVIATDAIGAWRTFVQTGEGMTLEAYNNRSIPHPSMRI